MSKSKHILLIISFIVAIVIILTGCTNNTENNNSSQETNTSITEFTGEKGQEVSIVENQILLDQETLDDGNVHFYNTKFSGEKIIYFFVVKDKQGIYRAAANVCQVCFDSRKGFRQEGDFMVCNTCGNKYPLEKIATEKGGCNPGPINPNLEVKDKKLIIEQSDMEQVAEFF